MIEHNHFEYDTVHHPTKSGQYLKSLTSFRPGTNIFWTISNFLATRRDVVRHGQIGKRTGMKRQQYQSAMMGIGCKDGSHFGIPCTNIPMLTLSCNYFHAYTIWIVLMGICEWPSHSWTCELSRCRWMCWCYGGIFVAGCTGDCLFDNFRCSRRRRLRRNRHAFVLWLTSELLMSLLILITESFTPILSSCCDTTDGLFRLDFIIFPGMLYWTLLLSILSLLWVLHCLYYNFQCNFTCVFYVSLSRTIVYLYICIFICLSFYWISGTSYIFGANVICFTMYRLLIIFSYSYSCSNNSVCPRTIP